MGVTAFSLHILQLPQTGGVFWVRSDLKIRVWKLGGGKCQDLLKIQLEGGCSGTKFQSREFWIFSNFSGSLACLCITDSLSHTTYVETNNGISEI